MREAHRSFRATRRKRPKIDLKTCVKPFSALQALGRPNRRVLEHLQATRGSFWTSPGRSWLAHGAPRSALGRHLGVHKMSQARPDASPIRPWAPKVAQERLFVDFGSVWAGFSSTFERFFGDLRSSHVRRRHKSRISKRSRVILRARLGSCVVDALRTARTSFQISFEHCMISFFSLRTHKPT